MLRNASTWLRKFWGVILAFVALIAFLANAAAVIKFVEEHWAAPTPLLTDIPASTPTPTTVPTHPPASTPTMGPFQFVNLPLQVKAGDDAEVILLAREGAVCHLDFYTPEGSKSSARGLGLVNADSMARCKWTWHISANIRPGRAKLVILINDIQETHEIEILPRD